MSDSNCHDLLVSSSVFISDNYQPDDRLAVVIRNLQNNQVERLIATAARIAMRGFQAWLRFENSRGGDIYVSMNPLKPDARSRTKSDIALVRHLYLDFDLHGLRSIETICNDSRIPDPSYVLNTSAGKYQVIWKVIGHDLEKAEQLQRAIALEYGADPTATDVTCMLRMPGFHNHTYDPPYRVTAGKSGFLTHTISEFRIGLQAGPDAEMPTHQRQALMNQSEHENRLAANRSIELS
jgi:hypothetical protein